MKGHNKLPNDYFPHDFNARYDRKILRARKVLGIEGYGIYWMLIETLCTQENFSYPIKDIDLLADDFNCSVEKVEAVIKQFGLFEIDKHAQFFSLSLIQRLQKYLDLSESGRKGALARWEKARKLKELQENNATALRPQSDTNSIIEYNRIEKDRIEDNYYNNDSFEMIKKLFISTWQRNYKNYSEILAVEKMLAEYSEKHIVQAFRRAAEMDKMNVAYVKGILKKHYEKINEKKMRAEANQKKKEDLGIKPDANINFDNPQRGK